MSLIEIIETYTKKHELSIQREDIPSTPEAIMKETEDLTSVITTRIYRDTQENDHTQAFTAIVAASVVESKFIKLFKEE